jgi:hypothetical protein
MASFSLQANRWKKVAQWYGLASRKVKVKVQTTRKCSWRRRTVAVIKDGGTFYGSKTLALWNAWLEVKSPVATTGSSKFV